MKIDRSLNMVHPILLSCNNRIDALIKEHNMPFKLFETGRVHDRQQKLINTGKTRNLLSRHLYNLKANPPLLCTAVDYVYYDGKWSWNLRDSTTASWYHLFGNLVLDACPDLEWHGNKRKQINYCHFQLKKDIILNNLNIFSCVTPLK